MKSFLLSVLLMVASAAYAQKGMETVSIRKVTAKDIRAMIDSSTGPLIVNFWASWCGPCIREIPWFDSIITERKAPVKLLLVSLDFKSDYPQKLSAFVKKQGYNGQVVFLNDTNSDTYIPIINAGWTGNIPASIFINNSANYYMLYNRQLPKEQFRNELDKLLNSRQVVVPKS